MMDIADTYSAVGNAKLVAVVSSLLKSRRSSSQANDGGEGESLETHFEDVDLGSRLDRWRLD